MHIYLFCSKFTVLRSLVHGKSRKITKVTLHVFVTKISFIPQKVILCSIAFYLTSHVLWRHAKCMVYTCKHKNVYLTGIVNFEIDRPLCPPLYLTIYLQIGIYEKAFLCIYFIHTMYIHICTYYESISLCFMMNCMSKIQ